MCNVFQKYEVDYKAHNWAVIGIAASFFGTFNLVHSLLHFVLGVLSMGILSVIQIIFFFGLLIGAPVAIGLAAVDDEPGFLVGMCCLGPISFFAMYVAVGINYALGGLYVYALSYLLFAFVNVIAALVCLFFLVIFIGCFAVCAIWAVPVLIIVISIVTQEPILIASCVSAVVFAAAYAVWN